MEPGPPRRGAFPRAPRPRRRAVRPHRRGSRRRPHRRRSPSPRSRCRSTRWHEYGLEPTPPRLEIELDRDRLLSDGAVRADGEHDLRSNLEVGSRRHAQPLGRAAEIAKRDPALPSESDQLRVFRDELVEAALDIEAVRDRALQQRPPGRRKPAALRSDSNDRNRRIEGEGVFDRADDRDPVMRLPRPGGVEDRDDGIGPVADDPAHRLAVVRVV